MVQFGAGLAEAEKVISFASSPASTGHFRKNPQSPSNTLRCPRLGLPERDAIRSTIAGAADLRQYRFTSISLAPALFDSTLL
jgi:hypothetical protein